jgi:hypothetical protein
MPSINDLVTIPLENETKFYETDSGIYQYICNDNAILLSQQKLGSNLFDLNRQYNKE